MTSAGERGCVSLLHTRSVEDAVQEMKKSDVGSLIILSDNGRVSQIQQVFAAVCIFSFEKLLLQQAKETSSTSVWTLKMENESDVVVWSGGIMGDRCDSTAGFELKTKAIPVFPR
jgi:hypothetical protein